MNIFLWNAPLTDMRSFRLAVLSIYMECQASFSGKNKTKMFQNVIYNCWILECCLYMLWLAHYGLREDVEKLKLPISVVPMINYNQSSVTFASCD